MKLLLDSNILLAIAWREPSRYGNAIDQLLNSASYDKIASSASIWEIAIKYRLGKLTLDRPIEDFPRFLQSLGCELLVVDHRHVVEDLVDQPATKDPFDRLLLAQCQIEGMRLVTIDRALVRHPLAWNSA
ncbi:MAG: type II toxin-antitoxin system VapC family toxin [Alphaproteobacteria bacterium]|nr:type II toxin-antitoxin system VapC family toxin [Alphaproteobacteria bacterium]